MGILKRMTDMTKASLNEVLDKIEDPVIMLNQYLRDLENEVASAEQTVARQMVSEQRLKQRYDAASRAAADCQNQAEQAYIAGNEEQARKLLEEKLHWDQQAQEYGSLFTQAEANTAELRNQLEDRRSELQALRSKRNELASRAQSAEAKKQVAQPGIQANHTIDGGSAARGFYRMEEKIMQLEAEAEVVRTAPMYRVQPIAPIASEAVDPLKEQRINEQLEAMKLKLNPDNTVAAGNEETK